MYCDDAHESCLLDNSVHGGTSWKAINMCKRNVREAPQQGQQHRGGNTVKGIVATEKAFHGRETQIRRHDTSHASPYRPLATIMIFGKYNQGQEEQVLTHSECLRTERTQINILNVLLVCVFEQMWTRTKQNGITPRKTIVGSIAWATLAKECCSEQTEKFRGSLNAACCENRGKSISVTWLEWFPCDGSLKCHKGNRQLRVYDRHSVMYRIERKYGSDEKNFRLPRPLQSIQRHC